MNKITYISFLGLITSGIFCSNVAAELYKWVDEDGNTHYSQSPPNSNAKVSTIKPPPKIDTESAIKEQQARKAKLDEIVKNRNEQNQTELKEREADSLNQENCRKARAKLENNKNTGRIRAVDEEGNVVRAGEEERQRRIKDAKEKVNKWCG